VALIELVNSKVLNISAYSIYILYIDFQYERSNIPGPFEDILQTSFARHCNRLMDGYRTFKLGIAW
jgi:hypothetical protein